MSQHPTTFWDSRNGYFIDMSNFSSGYSRSNLIATPTVDKNGRQTTVHKRASDVPRASASLASAIPSSPSPRRVEESHVIKPKNLSLSSTAVRVGLALGELRDDTDADEFGDASTRKAVSIPDDVLYEFLRNGVDALNAAALTKFGITEVDQIPPEIAERVLPGDLASVLRKNMIQRKEFGSVIERLQESGVSAIDANKLISNGLQDAHLDRALSDEQLVTLFSKWSYKSVIGYEKRGVPEQDDVITAFVDGTIPFELVGHKMNELKGLEYELNKLFVDPAPDVDAEDEHLREKLRDRDYLVTLAGKAIVSIEGYRPLREMNRLMEEHGSEVLTLKLPQLANIKFNPEGGAEVRRIGIEAARYIESVHDIAFSTTEDAHWMSTDRFASYGGLEVNRAYLRNYELLNLRNTGVSPEDAYDLLVNHKLSPDQIIAARETGVGNTMAQGVL